MEESSRGYRETSLPARDLMARFDMAHDRADRLPEVRRYLENLRPQILKLQRELRLVTQEDIDGLAGRDDLQMDDVDKLTALIKAFRKAWTENKVPFDRRQREEDERAFEAAGPAFIDFAERVRATFDKWSPSVADSLAAVRAMARAGEPRLAWIYYKRISLADPLLPSQSLPVLMAVWEGFARRGETPPFESDELTALMKDNSHWNADPSPMRKVSQLGLRLARILAEHGKPEDAFSVATNIGRAPLRLRALMAARDHGAADAQDRIDSLAGALHTRAFADQIACWSIFGNDAKAIEVFEEARACKTPNMVPSTVEVVVPLVRSGRTEEAFEIIEAFATAGDCGEAAGKMAVALLEKGDDLSLTRLLKQEMRNIGFMESEDAPTLIAELLRRDRKTDAINVAGSLAATSCAEEFGRAEALQQIVCAFAEHGMEPLTTMLGMEISTRNLSHSASLPFRSAIAEANVAIPLRKFKRAARIHGQRWLDPPGTFDRVAWESTLRAALETAPDIATQMSYDEPIE